MATALPEKSTTVPNRVFFPKFSDAEYRTRWQKIRDEMDERSLPPNRTFVFAAGDAASSGRGAATWDMPASGGGEATAIPLAGRG